MEPMYYIGLDVHELKISYCVEDSGGKLSAEGWIPATRHDLNFGIRQNMHERRGRKIFRQNLLLADQFLANHLSGNRQSNS